MLHFITFVTVRKIIIITVKANPNKFTPNSILQKPFIIKKKHILIKLIVNLKILTSEISKFEESLITVEH